LHIDGEFAGEPVAHIILGAHDVLDLCEDLRLMRLDPEQLGQGEVGQRRVAGQLDQLFIADLLVQPVALRLGARVAPDQRRAQHSAIFVQHHGTVHLAGEAEGGDCLARFRRGLDGSANRLLRGPPPVFRVLLRPAGMRRLEGRMLARCAADQLSTSIHNHGARSARAYIHPQKPHSVLPFLILQFLFSAMVQSRPDSSTG